MRALLPVALALLLGACVSTPRREPPAADPAAQRRELQQLQQFSFDGRLAAAAGGEGFNADIGWKQQDARSTVDLRAPLGFGSAKVVSDESGVKFTSSRGESLSGSEATAELTRRLGFAAPISALRFWVLGVADPARPAVETFNAEGRLGALEQDGWRIEYAEYRDSSGSSAQRNGLVLPRRMTVTREQIRLRLVIHHWIGTFVRAS
ncbi:MAG: lipoprotein insertase outer membrane protein LolB [Pseudomonadota bacterium]